MLYRKELVEYMNLRKDEINKILAYPHNMNKEDLEIRYKKMHYNDFYRMALEEEMAQENDLLGYIRILMRWKW